MTHKHTKPHAAADVVAAGDPTAVPAGDDGHTAHVVDDIAAQLARVQAEVSELRDAWLRAKAETDNVRKISQADVAKAHKYAVERFAEG